MAMRSSRVIRLTGPRRRRKESGSGCQGGRLSAWLARRWTGVGPGRDVASFTEASAADGGRFGRISDNAMGNCWAFCVGLFRREVNRIQRGGGWVNSSGGFGQLTSKKGITGVGFTLTIRFTADGFLRRVVFVCHNVACNSCSFDDARAHRITTLDSELGSNPTIISSSDTYEHTRLVEWRLLKHLKVKSFELVALRSHSVPGILNARAHTVSFPCLASPCVARHPNWKWS